MLEAPRIEELRSGRLKILILRRPREGPGREGGGPKPGPGPASAPDRRRGRRGSRPEARYGAPHGLPGRDRVSPTELEGAAISSRGRRGDARPDPGRGERL